MMKYYFTISLILLSAFGWAQLPESMRSTASSGVFESDWDYIYDPVDLSVDNEVYFFTSLTELKYKFSEFLNQPNEVVKSKMMEELPLGLAFNNTFINNLRHSLFIRFSHKLTPDNNDGEIETYSTNYISEGDYFSIKKIYYTRIKDYDDDNSILDFVWNNSYAGENMVFGLRFSAGFNATESDDATFWMGLDMFDPQMIINRVYSGECSFDKFCEFYHYDNNELYFRLDEKGDFKQTVEDNKQELLASVEFEENYLIPDCRLRLDLGFDSSTDISRNVDDTYEASFWSLDEDSLAYHGVIEELSSEDISCDQMHIFVGAQIKKELADNLNFNNNFHEFALQAGYISGESNNNYLNTQFWQRQHEAYFPEDADLFKSEFHNEINEKGDFAGINIKSNYRFNLELNRFASFGMGCWLDYDKIVFDLDYENSLEDIYTVKQGVEFDQVNDYITTETEHIYAEKQSISATSQLRLPIALEFRIADDDISSNDPFSLRNFVYRLSSTFFYNYSQLEDTYNTITSEPNMIIIEHGNGFVEEEHDTQSILTADKKITKRSSSRKQFAAGIGYRHSGNVSIDLAVIYDYPTDDYLFGLSFTIRK